MSDRSPTGLRAVAMVRRFLGEMGLSPRESRYPDRTIFEVAFEGPADQGVAQIVEGAERFVFHFILPGHVPVERRPNVSEFIARANWRLIEGGFQLDFDTGAVRFKVGIDFSGTELSEVLVRNAILSSMDAIETYAESLAEVSAGRMEAEPAVRALESRRLQ